MTFEVHALSEKPWEPPEEAPRRNNVPPWIAVLGAALIAIASYATGVIGS